MKVRLLILSLLVLDVAGGALGGNHLRSTIATIADEVEGSGLQQKHHFLEGKRNQKKKIVERNAKRKLNGPNDKLREFVSTAVLQVPDIIASESTWLGEIYLNVTDFRCFDITFNQISLNLIGEDLFQLEVTDLLFKCDMGISWAYGWFDGAGDASVVSDKNYVSTVMSTEATLDDPTTSSDDLDERCSETVIDIDTLAFEGDMSMRVLTLYRGFIRRVAEAKIEHIFCTLLSQDMLGLALNATKEKINDFSRDLPSWRLDPLFREDSVVMPDDGSIVDLLNDPQVGDLMRVAVQNLNSIYATRKHDPGAPTADNLDYGINTILREKILENRIFNFLEPGEIREEINSTPLVDIGVTVSAVKIHGLDTAIDVTPLSVIGSCTVQNGLSWHRLTLEVDLTVNVGASSDPSSIFENGNQMQPIFEKVKYTQHLDGVNVLASYYVPLRRSEVEKLPMGYILGWESLPACIPPVLFGMEVSGLDLTINDIQEPILEGIESLTIDEIAKKSAKIGLDSFEADIVKVVPAFVQTEVRDALTEVLEKHRCVEASVGRKLSEKLHEDIFFRDLSEEEFVPLEGKELWINVACALVCVCSAALAAGLTMGLLSLDELMLLIKQRAGATEKERKAADRLLPIIRQHHLLLVSLLLMNALANEALPLFLDKIVPGYVAVILSTTLVLIFGEIVPTALFTGPDQVQLASGMAPVVRFVMFVFSPIAWPIAKILDSLLHEESEGYNRTELSALVRIQYESHLAEKRERKNKVSSALREYQSQESIDSYTSRRSSGKAVRPEIKETLRAIQRQISQKHVTSDNLHVDEVTMVEGALQMGTTEAMDVYTPWNSVFSVPNDMILNERNTVRVYRSGFSRIPIHEKNPDDPDDTTRILGVLVSKQLIVVDSQDQREVGTLPLTIPRCVSPHTNLVDLVNMFQSGGVKGSHMALVCGRPEEAAGAMKNGKPLPDEANLMGVVTLEDVLESLIQEQIYDEFDRKEKKRLQLARWGAQRWKMFVKRRKKARGEPIAGTVYDSIKDPKMVGVVEQAVASQAEEPSESTSLLDRLNPFK